MTEKLGGFGGVVCGELFHLGEDVEELGWREGVEGAGDGVGAGEAWWEVYALWELGDRGAILGDWEVIAVCAGLLGGLVVWRCGLDMR